MSMRERVRPRARWAVPAVAVAAGVGYLVAGLLGDEVRFAVAGLVIMLATAVVSLLVARRSDTFAALLDRSDERINGLDLQATAITGVVLICAVLVMFLIELARGQDGSPYYQLAAVAGVTYIGTMTYLHRRR
jgi:amino acid transporter